MASAQALPAWQQVAQKTLTYWNYETAAKQTGVIVSRTGYPSKSFAQSKTPTGASYRDSAPFHQHGKRPGEKVLME